MNMQASHYSLVEFAGKRETKREKDRKRETNRERQKERDKEERPRI